MVETHPNYLRCLDITRQDDERSTELEMAKVVAVSSAMIIHREPDYLISGNAATILREEKLRRWNVERHQTIGIVLIQKSVTKGFGIIP